MADTRRKQMHIASMELATDTQAIIVDQVLQIVDIGQLDASGKPLVLKSVQKQPRIKLKSFHAAANVPKFAAAIVKQCNFLHDRHLQRITELLDQLKYRLQTSSTPDADPNSLHASQQHQHHHHQHHQSQYQSQADATDVEKERLKREKEQLEEQLRLMKEQQEQQAEVLRKQIQAEADAKAAAQAQAEADAKAAERKSNSSRRRSGQLHSKHHGRLASPSSGGDGSSSRSKRKKSKLPKASMKKVESYREQLYNEDIQSKLDASGMILQLVRKAENLEYFIENDNILGALSRILVEEGKKDVDLARTILEIFLCFSKFRQLHPVLTYNKVGDTTMRTIQLELKRYHMRMSEAVDEPDSTAMYKYYHKQDRLILTCVSILLNLADDEVLEAKMTSRDISHLLIRLLERDHDTIAKRDRAMLVKLHTTLGAFLHRLSIRAANITDMRDNKIVDRLVPLFDEYGDEHDMQVQLLRLVYNFSFDPDLRSELVKCNMVPYFIKCIQIPAAQEVALGILYNISADREFDSDAIEALRESTAFVADLILNCPTKRVGENLIALAINMGRDQHIAELMCTQNRLPGLIKRAHTTFDPLLMKLIRAISEHNSTIQHVFTRYLHEFAGMIMNAQSQDFLVEALGTMANIAVPDYLYSELLRQHNLLQATIRLLAPGFAEDDIVLEAIMVLGTFSLDPKAGPMLAHSQLIRRLHDLLHDKQHDEDMTVQLVYTIFRFLLLDDTRDAILRHELFPNSLLDLVLDPNIEVRRYAHLCLDIIMDNDEEWRDRLRDKRFEICNREWLDFMSGNLTDPNDDSIDLRGVGSGYSSPHMSPTAGSPLRSPNHLGIDLAADESFLSESDSSHLQMWQREQQDQFQVQQHNTGMYGY
jgi:kinesin-associated protein 3